MDGAPYTYLDYAASAPLCQAALDAERAYEASAFAGANPNSLHSRGRLAARALDGARRDLAACLGPGFRPVDVTFTSGGTESNNLALRGIALGMRARDRRRVRVVASAIEHDSVLDVLPSLRDAGFEVSVVRPRRDGMVHPEDVGEVLGEDVALVSLMAANNETGVVQPLAEVARRAHGCGAAVHTDAVQAFGRIALDLADVDAVSVAAHKIGGPVGVGALALRGRVPLRPQLFGGGQEQGRRPGTQDVRGALAFAAAARDCLAHLEERRELVSARAARMAELLCAPEVGMCLTVGGDAGVSRLPGLLSLTARGLDSETLILKMDQAGFGVSAGSACSSGSLDASHVLLAMGIARDEALGSLRISFDERVREEDLLRCATTLASIVHDERTRARR